MKYLIGLGMILAVAASVAGCSAELALTDIGDSDEVSDTTAMDADTDGDSDADVDGDSDSESDSDSDRDTEMNPDIATGSSNNTNREDRLTCEYRTISEDDTTFTGKIVVGNANTKYVWNGYIFTIYAIDFTTTSEITFSKTDDFIDIGRIQTENTVSFDMAWQSVFPLNTIITFNVKGNKAGNYPYPTRCTPRYIRGDVIYPVYQDLPHSFWKNKETLDRDDLIKDTNDYYLEGVSPITESIFVYDPPHDTQILIGQPEKMVDILNNNPTGDELLVNGYTDLRIFVPNKMMAMGIGFAYQWFKFNPNYFCALGTKENFACGLIPSATWNGGYPVTLEAKNYSWNYILSPDGPFQQETGNFIDMASFFPDYFPLGATHDDYTNVIDPTDNSDPKWATSVVSSALSSVVTRESLWAALGDDYYRMVFDSADPWAELSIITFAYNRGIYSVCPTGIFADMDALLASTNVNSDYGLAGVGDHVPQINGIVANMNQAVDTLYDADLSWEDIAAFFDAIHFIYGQGVPSDGEWNAMIDDLQNAYNVLAAHWGGDHVSFRYDFLTLLRVAQKHLPNPTNVRPTSQEWKDRATGPVCF